jgi:hypothetical protein
MLKVALVRLFPHGSDRVPLPCIYGVDARLSVRDVSINLFRWPCALPRGAGGFRKTAVAKPSMVNLPLFSAYQAWPGP